MTRRRKWMTERVGETLLNLSDSGRGRLQCKDLLIMKLSTTTLFGVASKPTTKGGGREDEARKRVKGETEEDGFSLAVRLRRRPPATRAGHC